MNSHWVTPESREKTMRVPQLPCPRAVRRLFMVLSFMVGGSLYITPAFATMDGSLASLTRDEARLSLELGQSFPCPLPEGTFSAIQKGKPISLSSLCMIVEGSSFLHHTKIREYIRIMPPEKVFGIYWEGPLSPQVFLGPDYPAYQTFLKTKKKSASSHSRQFLFLSRSHGMLVIDRTLLPSGLDPNTLSP